MTELNDHGYELIEVGRPPHDPDPLDRLEEAIYEDGYVAGVTEGKARQRRRDHVAAAMLAASIGALLIVAFLAGRASAAPRPGPQTTERVDLSALTSAESPTGAPSAAGAPRTSGIASWYGATGLIAAAGPGLRVGHWRETDVVVTANGRSVRVRLADWCACPARLIDLSDDAFRRLAPLSVGLVRVTVTPAGPAPTPPATDAQP